MSRDAGAGDSGESTRQADADQAAADAARARFRSDGLPCLPPDERIAPLLQWDERVVAVHPAALLDRREPAHGVLAGSGVAGDLYVTSRRLVLVGRLRLTVELAAIDDACLAGERLLLVLHDGHGVALDVAWPRLLRVEISSARAAARAASAGGGPGHSGAGNETVVIQ